MLKPKPINAQAAIRAYMAALQPAPRRTLRELRMLIHATIPAAETESK